MGCSSSFTRDDFIAENNKEDKLEEPLDKVKKRKSEKKKKMKILLLIIKTQVTTQTELFCLKISDKFFNRIYQRSQSQV